MKCPWLCGTFALLVSACGGSDDPGGGGEGSSSGSSSTSETSAATSSGGGEATTTSSGGEETTTSTTGSMGSSTGSGLESSSTGADTSSTGPGCDLGTVDCACQMGACEAGLVCTGGMCVPENCPQEDSEPNNVEAEAFDLGDFGDSNPTFQEVDGRLPVGGDVDWWSFHCNDQTLGQVDMTYQIDTNIPVRVCQFIACDIANNPTVTCPEGSDDAMSPEGHPGCCSNLPEFDIQDIDCSDVQGENDDSGQIFVRVDMPAQDMCVSYDLGMHC